MQLKTMASAPELKEDATSSPDLNSCNSRIEVISDQGTYKLILRISYCDFVVQTLFPKSSSEETDVIIRCLQQDFENASMESLKRTVLLYTKSHQFSKESTEIKGLVDVIERWVDTYSFSRAESTSNSVDNNEVTTCDQSSTTPEDTPKISPKSRHRQKCHQRNHNNTRPLTDDRADPSDGKAPMKTASDVISRILWDSALPEHHFVVGYTDRMLGIMERPFSEFDWSNFNTMDPMDNAIPRHRIQYFRYKHAVVWDRNRRYDAVFGSTFDPEQTGDENDDIFEIMKMEDSKDKFVEDDDEDESEISGNVGEGELLPQELGYSGYDPSTPASCAENTADNCNNNSNLQSRSSSAFDHFIYVTISDPRFIQCALNAQETLSNAFPEAVQRFYDASMLHVTIGLLNSGASKTSEESIVECLGAEESAIQELARRCTVEAARLKLLKDRVVVAKVSKPKLNLLIQHVANVIAKSQPVGVDGDPFCNNCKFEVPELLHVTLGRIKRPRTEESRSQVTAVLSTSRFQASSLIGRIGLRKIQDSNCAPLWEIDC